MADEKKRVTLTNRWKKWAQGSDGIAPDPVWAYAALICVMSAFLSLGIHLCFFLPGMIRGTALITMCVFAGLGEFCFIFRKQWWWASYWGICVILGVAGWEIASYFFGSRL